VRDHGVDRAHQQSPERREGLGVAEHRLAPPGVREELREPRHRGHELDADADEGQAAQDEEHRKRRGVAGGARRERVEQDAPDEHAPSAQAVGEVAAEEAEDAPRHRRHVEHEVPPPGELGAAELHAAEVVEGAREDERQHQELVGVEREADRRDDGDEPFDAIEAHASVGGVGRHVSPRALEGPRPSGEEGITALVSPC
jgi:hypothetical protein